MTSELFFAKTLVLKPPPISNSPTSLYFGIITIPAIITCVSVNFSNSHEADVDPKQLLLQKENSVNPKKLIEIAPELVETIGWFDNHTEYRLNFP